MRFMGLKMLAALVGLLSPAILVSQTKYNVTTLESLGGTSGAANGINNRGWATGSANLAGDNIAHAALWVGNPNATDLGTLGSPGLNSAVAWPVKANNGVIVGISDTDENNPLSEAFSCWPFYASGSPTGKICKGFRWDKGVMTALPPFPGGYNSYATAANSRGQVVGWAENGVHDPTCDPNFQVLQFRAVIWGPHGDMQELPPLPGDSTSAATAINDKGQVVGISGACGIAVGGVSAAHSVLWENGVPINIGDLGGHSWNTPTAINNQGTIVGFSLLSGQDGTTNYEAFVWTRDAGIHSLGKPAGDRRSAAYGINDLGQIVGLSRAPGGLRAMLWENGGMFDLNGLTPPGSPHLLYANDINDAGEIVGEAIDTVTGATPAFVALPQSQRAGEESSKTSYGIQPVAISDDLQNRLDQRAFRRLGIDPRNIR